MFISTPSSKDEAMSDSLRGGGRGGGASSSSESSESSEDAVTRCREESSENERDKLNFLT